MRDTIVAIWLVAQTPFGAFVIGAFWIAVFVIAWYDHKAMNRNN